MITLVPLSLDHIPEIMEVYRNQEVRKYIRLSSELTHPMAIAWLNKMLTSTSDEVKVIQLTTEAETKIIGICELNNIDWSNKKSTTGTTIAQEFWGQGYAKKATQQIIDYTFNALNFHQLSAFIFPNNVRSIGLYKRLGFQLEVQNQSEQMTMMKEGEEVYLIKMNLFRNNK